MKKILSIILVMVMCLSLCACGSKTDKIKDAMQGTWVAEWTAIGKNISRYYTFKGNKYTTGGDAALGELATETGTFEITDSVIKFTPDDNSEHKDIEYSYNEETGEIILWWNDDVQFQKGTVDPNY